MAKFCTKEIHDFLFPNGFNTYDVHRESLKVTLVEACNLSPLDNREPTINARCNVQLKSSKDPDVIIDPRPKYRLIPGTEGNAGGHGGGSNLPGEFKHAKTETVGAASSTVIWSTHHPVWNETFYFDVRWFVKIYFTGLTAVGDAPRIISIFWPHTFK
ncbi:unnamed protein product [Schistocephalus solidus]|uniref:C2 domain-containing protein n=1 Tax=Schistocephalus solidus TaxID=70667 RepID=A0A183T835_SCHSO|nr:unnamed protein product [Schistocephalus solidus]